MKKNKKAMGSSFDDFLKEQGEYETSQSMALKRVISWQIQKAMKEKHIAKTEMAKKMHTSRSQLDRLLDPMNDSITISTLARASEVLGFKIHLGLRTH